MQRHFDVQLDKLKESIIKMGEFVEQMISLSVKGFLESDKELIKEVSNYEIEVNDLQIEIDERSLRLLALMQPVATDLRFIVMVSKICSELERIGDLTINICQNTQYLKQKKQDQILSDLKKMSEISRQMLKNSINSFINKDEEIAKKVLESDTELDILKNNIFKQVKTKISDDISNIDEYLSLLLIAKNLERIGDKTTNIAEEVIYLASGKDVRHHHEEKERTEKI